MNEGFLKFFIVTTAVFGLGFLALFIAYIWQGISQTQSLDIAQKLSVTYFGVLAFALLIIGLGYLLKAKK